MSTTSAYRNPPEPPVVISDRQMEVLKLIAEGLTNSEIGERLDMNPRTVKAHSDVLRAKLGVSRRRMLGTEARKRGLIS